MSNGDPKRSRRMVIASGADTSLVSRKRAHPPSVGGRGLQVTRLLPSSPRSADISFRRSPRQHAELLQALGAIALRHGNPLRGLALIYVAFKLVPDDDDIIRSLAHAYLVNGEPELALQTLDALRGCSPGRQVWTVAYLRAKALMATGRLREAQALFARDVMPWIGGRR